MLDQAILIAGAAIFLAFGLSPLRRGRQGADVQSFTAGARDLSWFRFAAGLSMTFVGGAATLNMTGVGYRYGFQGLIDPIAVGTAMLLVVALTAYYRRGDALTITGALSGSSPILRMVASAGAFVFYLLMTGAQLSAITKLVGPSFPGTAGAVITIAATLLVFAYISLNGLSSVTITDVIQYLCLITLFAVPILYFAASAAPVDAEGGRAVSALNEMPLNTALLFGFTFLLVPVTQDVKIRMKASRSITDARLGALIAGVSYFVFVAGSVWAGRELFLSGAELADPEKATPHILDSMFGEFAIVGTLAVAAAIMSSLDSFGFAAIATLTNDTPSRARAVTGGYTVLLASALVYGAACTIALAFPEILGLILTALLVYVSLMVPLALARSFGVPDRVTEIAALVFVAGVIAHELMGQPFSPRALIYPLGHLGLVGGAVIALTSYRRITRNHTQL